MSEPKKLGELLNALKASQQLNMLESLVGDSEKWALQYTKTIRSLESGMVSMEKAAYLADTELARAQIRVEIAIIAAIRDTLRKTHARALEEGAELRAILEGERKRFLNEPVER